MQVVDTFVYTTVNAAAAELKNVFTVPRAKKISDIHISATFDMGTDTPYDYVLCAMQVVVNGAYAGGVLSGDIEEHIKLSPCQAENLNDKITWLADKELKELSSIGIFINNGSAKNAKIIIRIVGVLNKYTR